MSVQYTGEYSVHWGILLSTVEDTMSTPGDVQYTGGYHEYTRAYQDECGGYHEYSDGCSVHRGIP